MDEQRSEEDTRPKKNIKKIKIKTIYLYYKILKCPFNKKIYTCIIVLRLLV
jgi:hypothetical protein